MAYSGQSKIAFDTGFNDALYGRDPDNPYDQNVVGKSWQAYDEGYANGLISDIPPRGPKGDQGDTGDAGATGTPGSNGSNGSNGVDGNHTYVGSGAPGAGLGNDGDQYVDADSGDIYTKVTGTWNFQGNGGTVALATRTDTDGADPETIYRGSALPGTAAGASAWRCEEITIATDGDVTILFADGDDDYNNIWNNRASLSYS
jgi:hypothetical protein